MRNTLFGIAFLGLLILVMSLTVTCGDSGSSDDDSSGDDDSGDDDSGDDDSSDDLGDFLGSCDNATLKMCIEMYSKETVDAAELETACKEADGTWSEKDTCTEDKLSGKCTAENPDNADVIGVMFYYELSDSEISDAKKACADDLNGTWEDASK